MSLDDTLSEIALFKKETTYYVLILHYNYSRNVCGVLLSRKVFDCEKCICTLFVIIIIIIIILICCLFRSLVKVKAAVMDTNLSSRI